MDYSDISLKKIGLNEQTIELLNNQAIYTLEDLGNLTSYELRHMVGIGPKKYSEILECMVKYDATPSGNSSWRLNSLENHIVNINSQIEKFKQSTKQ